MGVGAAGAGMDLALDKNKAIRAPLVAPRGKGEKMPGSECGSGKGFRPRPSIGGQEKSENAEHARADKISGKYNSSSYDELPSCLRELRDAGFHYDEETRVRPLQLVERQRTCMRMFIEKWFTSRLR